MATLIQGKRGINSKLLVYEGYRYQLNKSRTTSMYWRCWKKSCRSSLKTNSFDMNNRNALINVIYNENAHDHTEESTQIEEQRYVQRMKDQIAANPTVAVKQVYNNVVQDAHYNVGINAAVGQVARAPMIPEFNTVRSSLQRTRVLQCPPLPGSIRDVQINGSWAETHLGERYLLQLDNQIGVAVFATDHELEILSNCSVIFVDGTFKTSPAPYTQVFAIHGEFHDRIINLSMALLTGKTQEHYQRVFEILSQEIQRVNGNARIDIRLVVADFEVGIHSAARVIFPNTTIGGCYYHFVQSLWRKAQEVGLTIPYRNDNNVKQCIRRCFCMGFLPINIVVNSFYTYTLSPNVAQLVALYPALQIWFNYINNTYIIGHFPLDSWNVFERGMNVRTNNYVESYFGKWNQTVGVKHPSLWTTIRKMKDQQSLTLNKIARARQGEPGMKRKPKWIRLEERINNLKLSLQNGQRNLDQYWEAISYVVEQV